MGCDITMHIEYRRNKDLEWMHFFNVGIWRDYILFASLGYERRDQPVGPISIKGFPARSISKETLSSFEMNGSNHDPSWMALPELNRCISFYNWKNRQFPINIEIIIVRDIMKSFLENGWESRIIFWFEN